MVRILECVTQEHVPWLVTVAAVVCVLSSITTFSLLDRSRAAREARRLLWLLAAAFAVGAGIWSTHFIAMLAYDPGVVVGYEVTRTLLSLVAAISVGLLSFLVLTGKGRFRAPLAGAMLAGGIALMHYLGMAGVEIPGRFVWEASLVLASLAVALILAPTALLIFMQGLTRRPRLAAGLALAVGIFALHFVAMSAATVNPDPLIPVTAALLPREGLAIAIAAAMMTTLGFATAGLVADQRISAAEHEATHLRAFANAAVEGIAICDAFTVIEANESFADLTGCSAAELHGRSFLALIAVGDRIAFMQAVALGDGKAFETTLVTEEASVPVEIFTRTIVYRNESRRLFAIRNLVDRKQAEAQIRFLAHHDSLTGLKNRASLHSCLQQEISRSRETGVPFALYCLDLDRFKEINDTFGHQTGDALLQVVAQRLRGLPRIADLVFRLGGDEFVFIRSGLASEAATLPLAERALRDLTAPILVAGRSLSIGASIGIAIHPQHGREAGDLLRNADVALYAAKTDGRGAHRLFDRSAEIALQEKRVIEDEWRQALGRQQLHLAYQPLVRADSGEISGFEALLRWRHPRLGQVPPTRFIPVAEEDGTISAVGAWVMREACREAARWPQPLSIAVNLSPVQFRKGDLAEMVRVALAESGLAPSRLEVEVTEAMPIRDPDLCREALARLKTLGVRIALDDFGAGYSSVKYLKAFPFDKIKIDRSFISDIEGNRESRAIVKAVIGLAHSLDLEAIAEGVETESQLSLLREHDCDAMQGFLLGRPADISTYRSAIRHGRPVIPPRTAVRRALSA